MKQQYQLHWEHTVETYIWQPVRGPKLTRTRKIIKKNAISGMEDHDIEISQINGCREATK